MPGSLNILLALLFLCALTTQPSPVDAAAWGQSQAVPQPNPDASGKYHVGDGVSEPMLLFAANPECPDIVRRKRVQGKILLSLIVDSQGNPQNVRVLHPLSDTVNKKLRAATLALENSAVEAVKQYRFDPALFQGKPVSVEVKVEVNFGLY